ncbi:MAG: efflux RND transporter periplasmic adaptor subunit [Myxococcales bacterium]|nr:efflux RND transporter periplasmic adaptor subunit [Myxococcales bacterium]
MAKTIAKTVAWVLILGALGYGGYYTYKKRSAPTQKRPRMRTAKVGRSDFKLIVSATGAVEPLDIVEIRPKATGEVTKINFEEGQVVTKGQLLVQLDPIVEQRRLNQARADLAIARANVLKAQRVYEHQLSKYNTELKLLRKRLTAKEKVDDLKHEVAVRKAELAVVKAQLLKAFEQVKEAKDRLDDTKVLAPFKGVILTRTVKLGQIIFSGLGSISGGTLVARMADLNTLYVRVDVDEADVARIRPNHTCSVTVDALPNRSFGAKVIRVNPEGKTVNNVTTFEVIIELDDAAAKAMLVRMTANVRILIEEQKNKLVVPSVAVRKFGKRTGVFVMVDGKPTFRPIKPGTTNGTLTVIEGGVKEDETIVLSRIQRRSRPGGRFMGMGRKK